MKQRQVGSDNEDFSREIRCVGNGTAEGCPRIEPASSDFSDLFFLLLMDVMSLASWIQ